MARLVTALLFTLALAAPAQARDHDKLPDRWERKHHLDTRKNDARRDRDRDGLSNYREYRAHTNPRKKDSDRDGLKDGVERRFGFKPRDRDSDDDGIKDGKENAGKIVALTGSSITIKLAAGGRLTAGLAATCDDGGGAVDSGDEAADDPADDPESDAANDDTWPDDVDDPDEPELRASAAQDDDDPADPDDSMSDADFDRQFDQEFASGPECAAASSLKRGQLVHEATVDRSGPGPVVTAVVLVRR